MTVLDLLLSRVKKLPRRLRATFKLATAFGVAREPVAYVGWAGNGNLGDDAMLAATRALFPKRRIVHVPNAEGLRWLDRTILSRSSAVCLGGGTLILNGHFRETLQRVLDATPGAHRFMLGPGVEDLDFRVGRRASVTDEVDKWKPILGQFAHVRVRGPLSQRTLRSIGVDSQVSADVAMALDWVLVPTDRPVGRTPHVGLNFGTTDDLWGNDEHQVEKTMLELARQVRSRGWDVSLTATTTDDYSYLVSVAAKWRTTGLIVSPPVHPTIQGFLGLCHTLDVMVGEKLHAVVLAARAGVPTVALEYRPKCRDFQATVGREDFVVRTDQLDPDQLMTMVARSVEHGSAQRAELRSHVFRLEAELRDAAEREDAAMKTGRRRPPRWPVRP